MRFTPFVVTATAAAVLSHMGTTVVGKKVTLSEHPMNAAAVKETPNDNATLDHGGENLHTLALDNSTAKPSHMTTNGTLHTQDIIKPKRNPGPGYTPDSSASTKSIGVILLSVAVIAVSVGGFL